MYRASPRLKDAVLSSEDYPGLYRSLVLTIRRLFHACHLVHADLSEYNILIHDNKPYIIDVSQAVEHDHPHAFDFLRSDIKNVEEFFGRYGVKCLGIRKAFEFVTREEFVGEKKLSDEEVLEGWLDKLDEEHEAEVDAGKTANANLPQDDASGGSAQLGRSSAAHEDAVFMQSYIPRTLNEVYDPERDVDALTRGDGNKLIYADTIGVVKPNQLDSNGAIESLGPAKVKSVKLDGDTPPDSDEDEDDEDDSEDDEENDEGEEGEDGKPFADKKPRGHRNEDRDAKKGRKKAAKEEAREKRKHKMKKADKKKKIKASKH